MTTSNVTNPPVTWAQRKEYVIMSIMVPDCKVQELNIRDSGLTFRGTSNQKEGTLYVTEMDLFAEILPETSTHRIKDRSVELLLHKKDTSAAFWPKLLKGTSKPHWLKVDFDRWKDEDEANADDNDENDFATLMNRMGGSGKGDVLQELDPSFMETDDEDGVTMPPLED